MLKEIFSVSLLVIGFIFTFFISGSSLAEFFFPKLPVRIKFPLYFILSLVVSTYTVYLVGLVLGFSRFSILVSFLLFVPLFTYMFKRIVRTINLYIKNHHSALVGGMLIYVLFFTALYPAIFTWHNGYIVMSSTNWQDTAMHMGIIESVTQGNFPPQAPYYSGVPLTYYYFADFHSAVLATLYGNFFPRILVYDNPFFALMFVLAIYTLSYELTRKKAVAFLSAFTGTLFGSYIFVKFFSDLQEKSNLPLIDKITQLLTNHSYSMEYEKLFQIPNFADYFLQNRPMMIGLPVSFLVIGLLLYAFPKRDLKTIFLSGILTGLLIKFQFFAVVASTISFLVILFFYLKKYGARICGKYSLAFLVPIMACYLLFSNNRINSQSLFLIVKDNFQFGPWEKSRDLLWHLRFMVSNFGVTFFVTLISLIYYVFCAFKKQTLRFRGLLVSFLALVFFFIPYCASFTVYKGDMFKFFYFMAVFCVIATFWFLDRVIKNKYLKIITFTSVVVASTSSSFLTLINSMLNKNQAYSKAEYMAGLWIRRSTPEKSVFITNPTVHCAVTQIGGRLRVLSYINWPYSHGYNSGPDNVFARLEDIKKLYTAEDKEAVKEVLTKYNARYIYLSSSEKGEFPQAESIFNEIDYLKKVYSQEGITIYEVI